MGVAVGKSDIRLKVGGSIPGLTIQNIEVLVYITNIKICNKVTLWRTLPLAGELIAHSLAWRWMLSEILLIFSVRRNPRVKCQNDWTSGPSSYASAGQGQHVTFVLIYLLKSASSPAAAMFSIRC